MATIDAHANLDFTNDCAAALIYDRDAHGVYFNRWVLDPRIDLQRVHLHAINEETDRHRPLLILDTNPKSELWAHVNIVRPQADREFEAAGYEDLTDAERGALFQNFLERADAMLRSNARPILTVDHHFDSRLLATASSTPLMVNFLTWLLAQPDAPQVVRVRDLFSRAQVLRDHSDADTVLATFAKTLLDAPDKLAKWGPLISRIALFNDHVELSDALTATEITEVELGYALMVAYEKFIARYNSGGFEWALNNLERTLAAVVTAASNFAGSDDPVRDFLHSSDVLNAPDDLAPIYAFMRRDWYREKDLAERIDHMLRTGQHIRRVGRVLIMTFPPDSEAPPGMSVLRKLKTSGSSELAGIDALVVVAKQTKPDIPHGALTHVKLRAVAKGYAFDAVVAKIVAKGTGGGGRGRAAGLYASSGVSVDDAELREDVDWLVRELQKR